MTFDSVKTLNDLAAYAAESFGGKTYIKEKCGSGISEKSFTQFYEDSRRMCAFINERAGGEKIHVAIIGPTCYNYIVSYFGAVIGGNASVPLDAQLGCEDLCDLIARADVSM
ncbi:MAG: AMP-binding protein, partial [Oscillospiraceae bacterium]